MSSHRQNDEFFRYILDELKYGEIDDYLNHVTFILGNQWQNLSRQEIISLKLSLIGLQQVLEEAFQKQEAEDLNRLRLRCKRIARVIFSQDNSISAQESHQQDRPMARTHDPEIAQILVEAGYFENIEAALVRIDERQREEIERRKAEFDKRYSVPQGWRKLKPALSTR